LRWLGCTTHGGKEAAPPPAAFLQLCGGWAAMDAPTAAGQAQQLAEAFVGFCLPPGFAQRPGGAALTGKLVAAFQATSRWVPAGWAVWRMGDAVGGRVGMVIMRVHMCVFRLS